MSGSPVKRVAVIGAGAVGGILAAALTRGDREVTIAEVNPTLLAALPASGLQVSGRLTLSARCPRVFRGVEILAAGPYDLVVIAVKVPALAALAAPLREHDHDQTRYLVACNGLHAEVPIVAALPADRVSRALLNFAARVETPSSRQLISIMDDNVIGACAPAGAEAARQLAALLTDAGLPTRATDAIERAVWERTLLSAALSALCAVTGMTMRATIRHSDGHALMLETLREGVAVAAASGVALRESFLDYAVQFLERSEDHLPSLAVDLRDGRDLEVDSLNGAIVAAGEACGVPAPCNRSLTALVHLLRDAHRPCATAANASS
jgi:2-dehydropantoate 2-reductase